MDGDHPSLRRCAHAFDARLRLTHDSGVTSTSSAEVGDLLADVRIFVAGTEGSLMTDVAGR